MVSRVHLLTHTLPMEIAVNLLQAKVRNRQLFEVDCQAIDAGMANLRHNRRLLWPPRRNTKTS